MSVIRVLIADDHQAIRQGLRTVLEGHDDLRVVGEATNGEEAVEQTQELKPDLIILDVSMPILDGLGAAREIKKFSPDTPIVMFSMYKIRELVDMAKRIGIRGYVSKDENGHGLLKAVDAVLHEQTYFPA